jgi:hypothetical protein
METEKELKTLIEIIMRMSDEMQKFIWDDVFHFDNAKLKDFFDKVIELPYTYTVDESFESFCKLIKEVNNEKEQTDNLGDND